MQNNGSFALTRVTSYSTYLTTAAAGTARRGVIHSAFNAAANIVFPDGLVLSLNAADSARMPNGLEISSSPGTFPFISLRPAMSVLFGALRLHIESADCSLDLSHGTQWNPHINKPEHLDRYIIVKNREWLASYLSNNSPSTRNTLVQPIDLSLLFADTKQAYIPPSITLESDAKIDILPMARCLCGRGIGLTPSGDDILAGWIAVNWLLYGPIPCLLEAFQQIIAVASQQTHLLSQCWLEHATKGNVAHPVKVFLDALSRDNETALATATQAVTAMGATSGYDLLQGILLGLTNF
jgi:Protein of unknown function (DUF2877)